MIRPSRTYRVEQLSGVTFDIRASYAQTSGTNSVTLYRDIPGTDPDWNPEYGPQVESLMVGMFCNVSSVVLVEEE